MLFLTKENVQTKSDFFTGNGFSTCHYLLDVLWRGNSQNKDKFFSNYGEF